MFETETQEVIQDRILARIDDNLDKREGSLIQTAIGPAAAELAQEYIALDGIMTESFADTQTREYLIRRAAERGLAPIPASFAVVHAVFNVDTIPVGSRFSCGDFTYIATVKESDRNYRLACETAGSAANGVTGTLLPMVTIEGLTYAQITEVIIPGSDEEETEAFRARYLNSFASQAFGGNRADYIEKALKIPGVGAVKVHRASSISGDDNTSGGNVRLTILNSDYEIPSAELVDVVKQTFDPEEYTGEGYGLAPIGHHVVVNPATATTCDITMTVTYSDGYSYDDVAGLIEAAVDAYFKNMAEEWANNEALVVRMSYIQNAVIKIEGIIDCVVTRINDSTANLTLDADAIPVRGVITCN